VSERVRAPASPRRLTVVGHLQFGTYHLLRLADYDGPAPQPGQFAMLAAAREWGGGQDERPYLPRAFSVARWSDGEADYLIEDVGPGTHRLCALQPGDEVTALGPLGSGFSLPPNDRRAILVGGGVGIAPLMILQDALAARDCTVLLGFRDRGRAEGAALLHDARVATDDGSLGHHGLVTDLLAAELERAGAERATTDTGAGAAMRGAAAQHADAIVYACGPAPMLEAVRALCAARDVPAQLALESGMACGFGACFGCVVPTREGYVRVCVDGPVIDAAALERVDAHAGAPA
jgi:dihydroorotate dehydrogenase electron transfer subunit